MPRRSLGFLLMIIFILTLSAGCGLFGRNNNQDEDLQAEGVSEQISTHFRKTVFYFANENNLLVPIARDIPWVEGIGKAAVESLVDSDELRQELADKGLKPTLPKGTEILGMTIRDGLAKVDFNSNFMRSQDKLSEQNAIKSVVYTLTEFPTVDMVQILVEGKTVELTPNGNRLDGIFKREGINLETPASTSADMIPVALYFKGISNDGNFSYYIPVTRMIPISQTPIKAALEELIKGPVADNGLFSALPKDTQVLDVIQQEREVIVNFSKEIEEYGGGIDAEQSIVNSVVLTVSEFPGVEAVSIQVEGQAGTLPEGTVLDTPILKPLYVNPDSI